MYRTSLTLLVARVKLQTEIADTAKDPHIVKTNMRTQPSVKPLAFLLHKKMNKCSLMQQKLSQIRSKCRLTHLHLHDTESKCTDFFCDFTELTKGKQILYCFIMKLHRYFDDILAAFTLKFH